MQEDLFPMNDLTAILSAGEGGASPLPPADPLAEHVLRHGMTDMDSDDDRPGIHISGGTGGIKVLADPARDQARERVRLRARMGPPPQPVQVGQHDEIRMTAREFMERHGMITAAPSYPMASYAPVSMGAQVNIQAVDFNRGVLVTSHGAIPLSPETVNKIMQLSVATMREFFAESVNATMQAYGLGGKRRAKPKRKRKPKV